VDAESRGDDRVPEQPAVYLHKWQNADDLSMALGVKIVRSVAEAPLYDVLPTRLVKKCRSRVTLNEVVPKVSLVAR
jgi:hypothetical protein